MLRKLTIMAGALLVAAAITVLQVSSVLGHANYDHSTPGQNQFVSTQPVRVDVWYTQNMDPAYANTLNVLGPGSVDVDNNDTVLDGANHKHLYITLQTSLPQGTYTVQWMNKSAEDGHEASGQYSFIYGPGSVGGITSLTHVDVDDASRGAPVSSEAAAGAAVVGLLGLSAVGAGWLARRRLMSERRNR